MLDSFTLEQAFRQIPTFSTVRLLLRPIEERDAQAIFSIKGDSRVTEPYGTEPHADIDVTRRWVHDRLTDHQKGESMTWIIALKDGHKPIGDCCYWHIDRQSMCAEIGYELHPDFWHQRIVPEALSPVLDYGFETMGLHRIEACPLVRNEPSKKLLLRLGFKNEGTLRGRVLFRGRYFDQDYYSLLKGELNSSHL